MSRLLGDAESFAHLTMREQAVCVGILTGYTSEAIALNLSISVNSVLTYRKRVYEKLRITSQNELFMLVIRQLLPVHDVSAGSPAQNAVSPV